MKYASMVIALFFLSFVSVAQENDSYIEVAGQYTYEPEVDSYQADFEVSMGNNGATGEGQTVEGLKDRFLQRATELGIEESRISIAEKDPYDTRINAGDRLKLVIKTDSKDEFLKALSLDGHEGWTYKIGQKVSYKPLDNKQEVIAQAMKNAREQAEIVATAISKKLGEVLVVADYNSLGESSDSTYEPMGERKYRIMVRFTIE